MAAGYRQLIASFNGGELSPRMIGRVDLDGIYDRGLQEMFNFVPTVEGPAVKRPGFRFIRAAAASSTWLTRFVFNVTQAYVIEWLDGALRFFTNGGQIESAPGVPYQVAVPYSGAEASAVSISQSYDRLRLAHGAHPPGVLTRTGAQSFVYGAATFRNGPFKDQNGDEAVTVTVTGDLEPGGVATVTASSPIFSAGRIGAPFLIECKDFSDVPAWEVGLDGVVGGSSRRHSDGKVYLAASSGRTGSVQPTHSRGIEYDGSASGQDVNTKGPFGVRWEYQHDRFGIGTITSVGGGGTTAQITVTRRIPESLATVPSHRWAHAAFSIAEGYPHLVCLAFGRAWWFKGVDFYVSVAGDYDNFARFTDGGLFSPDMGFHRQLDSADPPLWVRPDKEGLLVGTASAELLIAPVNRGAVLSGDNVDALPQSVYGSAKVYPVDAGTGFLFVQRGGRKVRAAEFAYERERFVGPNITAWARHITRSNVAQLCFQQDPEEMLFGVRGDGLMFAHAYAPEQQVKGFGRVALANGAVSVLSAVSIPSDDGTRDDVWVLTRLGGEKHICKMADWWEEDLELGPDAQLAKLKAAFFVDLGVSYSGAPKTDFNDGLDHLIGREVRILADGGVVPAQIVQATNPKIRLPIAAGAVHIGLGYRARLTPMRPEVRGAPTVQGLRKRIGRMLVRLIDAAAVMITVKDRTDRLIDRPGNAPMDQPVPLFTGDTRSGSIDCGYDREGQPTILSDDPLPCIVAAGVFDLHVEDRT